MSDVTVSAASEVPAGLLLDPDVIEDPYEFYRRLREVSPVWQVPGSDVVVVGSFAAISEVIGRPEDFSSNIGALLYRSDDGTPALIPFGGEETNVLATADPPVHGMHRGAVFPELMNRRMAALRPEVDELAREHIGKALGSDHVEFMGAIGNAIPIRVISRLIAFRDERPDDLLAAAFDSTEILSAVGSLEDVEAAMARTAVISGWIAEQLQDAIDGEAEGLLDVIATAVKAGEIDFVTGLIIMHTLLSAGGESTTSLLGNAVHMLALDADLQDRLRADPALITPFIEEVLRLESPFRYHLRQVRNTTEVQGTTVRAGSTMLLLWGSGNRDPEEYDRPDEIVLERKSARHHLGFGRGIHLCVGAPLARLEAEVVLGRFLEMTAHFALDPDSGPEREASLMVRRFRRLPLVVTPRS
jgi:cytochrome P450